MSTDRDTQGRWQSGASGNPKGRPRLDETLTSWLRRLLAAPVGVEGGEPVPRIRGIAERLIVLAEGGDLRAIQILAERLEGRPRLTVQVECSGDDPPRLICLPVAVAPEHLREKGAANAEARLPDRCDAPDR